VQETKSQYEEELAARERIAEEGRDALEIAVQVRHALRHQIFLLQTALFVPKNGAQSLMTVHLQCVRAVTVRTIDTFSNQVSMARLYRRVAHGP
jgi:hypothetical protein